MENPLVEIAELNQKIADMRAVEVEKEKYIRDMEETNTNLARELVETKKMLAKLEKASAKKTEKLTRFQEYLDKTRKARDEFEDQFHEAEGTILELREEADKQDKRVDKLNRHRQRA